MSPTTYSRLSVLLCFPLVATADPVDESQVTDFQAGQPALASEVNQNFQALINAINDNAIRIQGLEARLAATASTLQDRVAGQMYQVVSLGSGIGNTFNNFKGRVTSSVFGESALVTLNANGSLSYQFNGRSRETAIDVAEEPTDPTLTRTLVMEGFAGLENGTDTGTWSLAGQVLTLTLDGEADSFFMSPDGSMFLSGGADQRATGGVTLTEADIVVGVRVSSPDIHVELDNTGQAAPQRIEAVNNGPAFHLFNAVAGTTDEKRIYIGNNGNADLHVTGAIVVQPPGAGFAVQPLGGVQTVAPGAVLEVVVSSVVPEMNDPEFASVQLYSDDPDTQTFIVNIKSESASAPSPP